MRITGVIRKYFYPRPPRGGRRMTVIRGCSPSENFYPRPPRGGRRVIVLLGAVPVDISIHALREEGDPAARSRQGSPVPHFYPRPPRGGRQGIQGTAERYQNISIHALREEGDDVLATLEEHKITFLSTPSARRATSRCSPQGSHPPISIHALREEGDRRQTEITIEGEKISIHALREEGDIKQEQRRTELDTFLSTPSARRATGEILLAVFDEVKISIHALREEGDLQAVQDCPGENHFYPRPPRGGRPTTADHEPKHDEFLSTPSARRATGQTIE